MPTDPLFYLVGLPAAFLMALGKGAFGGGLAILGIPLLALVVDPVTAAIMMAPLISAMDVFAIQAFPFRTWSRPDMMWLTPPMIIGVLAGAAFFVFIDPRFLAAGIAAITLWTAGRYFLGGRNRPPTKLPVAPVKAVICGFLSGFTTFIAHAGGPPLVIYLIPRGLPKSTYAGTMVGLFTISNVVKLIPYLVIGLHHTSALWHAVALMPAVPFGVWLGKLLHNRLDERKLYFWCYLLVGIAGLKLLFDTVKSLI